MKFDILESMRRSIPRNSKLCFFSGIILGMLTHIYMLTHKLPNWDDMNSMEAFGSGDYLGRWMLKYLHPLGSIYSIPAVHGFLFILCLSISACLVLEILQIKSTTSSALTAGLMVTFPAVASTMTFMFMAHTSGFAILFVCLGVYLLRRYRYGFIPFGILLIMAMGIYQSYVSIAITLILLSVIIDIIKGADAAEGLKKGITGALAVGISTVIYMILCHVIYPNIDNETYGGVGNMGHLPIMEIPRLIGRCYKRFLEYFVTKPFDFITDTYRAANIIICIIIAMLLYYLISIKGVYKDKLRLSFLLLCVALIPFASAFIYFMAPEVDYSMLMLFPYVFVYVFMLALLDICILSWDKDKTNLPRKNSSVRMAVVAVGTFAIALCIYCSYLVSNQAYLRMELSKDKVEAYFNRIIAAVENTEGYNEGDKVSFVGEFYYIDNPSPVEKVSENQLGTDMLRSFSGVALENGLLTSGVRNNFIRYFIGFDMYNLTDSESAAIKETEVFKAMPVYPAQGCVRKIDDIWVVKLCE